MGLAVNVMVLYSASDVKLTWGGGWAKSMITRPSLLGLPHSKKSVKTADGVAFLNTKHQEKPLSLF